MVVWGRKGGSKRFQLYCQLCFANDKKKRFTFTDPKFILKEAEMQNYYNPELVD